MAKPAAKRVFPILSPRPATTSCSRVAALLYVKPRPRVGVFHLQIEIWGSSDIISLLLWKGRFLRHKVLELNYGESSNK